MHRLCQRIGQGTEDCFINSAFVTELDFTFLGMHIHVDGSRVNLDIQHGKGKPPLGYLGLIGMLDGLADHQIADAATVYQNGLPAPGAFQQRGLADKSLYQNAGKHTIQFYRQQILRNFFPVQRGNCVFQIPQSGRHQHFFIVAGQFEPHIRPGQGDACQHFRNITAFRRYRFQKLPAGRYVIE